MRDFELQYLVTAVQSESISIPPFDCLLHGFVELLIESRAVQLTKALQPCECSPQLLVSTFALCSLGASFSAIVRREKNK